jgi:predicted AlkP superfamily phosphohydrolase/phosphomutase
MIREGLLVLNEYPKQPTPFEALDVNWSRTRAWGESGYYGRIFFNVQGREPQGAVPPADYEKFQAEIKARLEGLDDGDGRPLKALVLKPRDLYQDARNVAPDLIVHFGGLHWRSIGTVGHSQLCLRTTDAGLDGCNDSRNGMFVLAAPNCPLGGEYEGARLLDMAPTLLDLAGYEVPESMQGRSLAAGLEKKGPDSRQDSEAEKLIHDRLAGLGYI